MQPVIYVDLRCLQDINYRVRGIGHHVAALLRTRGKSGLAECKTVGLTDPRSPELPDECASWVDEVSRSVNPCCGNSPAVFIDGTPMTHDSRFSIRFFSNPAFLNAAVVYDFIPLDWSGYLPTTASRIDYLAKLARLRKFNRFFPISEYTAWRLSELLGIHRDQSHVTGASVRQSLYEIRKRLGNVPLPYEAPYFLMVLAADARKNPEVAVKAVRYLNLLYSRRVGLKVVGHYDEPYRRNLLQLAGHAEGVGFLEFFPNIPDEELVSLFAGAVAALAPSHIEGFSLPVVEGSLSGCPVVASTCAAHLELVNRPEALFPSHDHSALVEKLDALLNNPALRVSLLESQAPLAAKFHEEAVGARFWNGLQAAVEQHAIRLTPIKLNKPRLAFLSPYPPDQSGVARYTAMTMRGGEKLFTSDLYTDAPRPLSFEGTARDAGPVSLAPLVDGRYNAVISVLGNSPFHTRIFEIFERYGGPCILHDTRLTAIYFYRMGREKFLNFASGLLGRPISMDEVSQWLLDQNLPSLFLEPVIERAAPLIVHTLRQQTQIKEWYGVDAKVVTSCPTTVFDDDELTPARKQLARERLGIPPATFLVASFGIVDPVKGMEICVLATEILRSWNIPAELYFVGSPTPGARGVVNRIADLYGVGSHVHIFEDFVDHAVYRDFLIAADAAIQLRTYGFGQFSAALTDCISAGLRSVASSDLAISCDAPEYVSTVPDRFSQLQVAEQLALLWEDRNHDVSTVDARACYLATHNFEHYAKQLISILNIA